MKYPLIIIVTLLLLTYTSYRDDIGFFQPKQSSSSIIVKDYSYIENWKKNHVRILKVDTIKTVNGNWYEVKFK